MQSTLLRALSAWVLGGFLFVSMGGLSPSVASAKKEKKEKTAKADKGDKKAKGDKKTKGEAKDGGDEDEEPAFDLETDQAAALAAGQMDAARQLAVAKDAGRVPETAKMGIPFSSVNTHALAAKSDMIDYEALLQETFTEAKRRAAALKKLEPYEKQRLRTAKESYKNAGRSAKAADKQQKTSFNAWSKARKAEIKKLPKAEKKAAEKGFKAESKAKKKELQNLSKKMKNEAKRIWQKAQRHYKAFQKELKDARYQARVMPKYKKKLKPKLLRELKKLNKVLQKVTKDAAGEGGRKGVSLAAVAKMRGDVVLGYLKWLVGERVRPSVEKGIGSSLDNLFKVLDKVVAMAIRAIVAAVGSVPFVGGILAAAASAAGTEIYGAIKKTVTNSIRRLGVRIADRLVNDLGDRLFKIVSVGTPEDDAVAAAAIAAANRSNAHLELAANAYEKQAAASEVPVGTIRKEAVADATRYAKEAEADQKEIASAELDSAAAAPAQGSGGKSAKPGKATKATKSKSKKKG